jgi:E3 ubiquitin-protein ligase BRE1
MQYEGKKKQKQRKKQYHHGGFPRRTKAETASRAIAFFTQENQDLQDVLQQTQAFFTSFRETHLPRDHTELETNLSSLDCVKAYLQGLKQKLLEGLPLDSEGLPADEQTEAARSCADSLKAEARRAEASLEDLKRRLNSGLASLATDEVSRPPSDLQDLRVKIKSAEQLRDSVKRQRDLLQDEAYGEQGGRGYKGQQVELTIDLPAFTKSKSFSGLLTSAKLIKSRLDSTKTTNAQLALERERWTPEAPSTKAEAQGRACSDLISAIEVKTGSLKRARSEVRSVYEELSSLQLKPLTDCLKTYQTAVERSLEERQALAAEIKQLQETQAALKDKQYEHRGTIAELASLIKSKVRGSQADEISIMKQAERSCSSLSERLEVLRTLLLRMRKELKHKANRCAEQEDNVARLSGQLNEKSKAGDRLRTYLDRSAKQCDAAAWKNASSLTQIDESYKRTAARKEEFVRESLEIQAAKEEHEAYSALIQAKTAEEELLARVVESYRDKTLANQELIVTPRQTRINSTMTRLLPPPVPEVVTLNAERVAAEAFSLECAMVSQAISLQEVQSSIASSTHALTLINAARAKCVPDLSQEEAMLRVIETQDLALCEICKLRAKEVMLTECMHCFCRVCVEKRSSELSVECYKCRVKSALHQVKVVWWK